MESAAQNALYPVIQPYDDGRLAVSDGHEIYYCQYGNPAGQPALVLHGGPGAGAGPNTPRFFDPATYRIVVFDQRGCGRSTPHGELAANTTWHLVADIERLRSHLAIGQWLLFGGSWGSTLALVYAATHPGNVTGLILRGIFTLRRHEIDWFYQSGANALLPDAFDRYRDPIPPTERDDLIAAYYQRLTDPDIAVRLAAARHWTAWEAEASSMGQQIATPPPDEFALAFARIECHYFVNGGFLDYDGWVLDQIERIRQHPVTIVQGRLDLVTPLQNAWDLVRAWPEAELTINPDAGHSAFDSANVRELIRATERFKSAC